MKTRCFTLFLLLLFAALLLCAPGQAENAPAGHGVCGGYEYDHFADCTARITYYAGNDTELNIPSVLDGYTVTSLGPEMFYRRVAREVTDASGTHTSYYPQGARGGILSVTVPESVTEICDRAFAGCSALRKVDLPGSISRIGQNAFAGCAALEVTAPSGSYAARRCEKLGIPFACSGLPGQEPYDVCRSEDEFRETVHYYARLKRRSFSVSVDKPTYDILQASGFWVELRRGGVGDFEEFRTEKNGKVYTYVFESVSFAPYIRCDSMEDVHKALAYCSSRQLHYLTLDCDEDLYLELSDKDCLPIARVGRYHGFFDERCITVDETFDLAFMNCSYYPGYRVSLLAAQGLESTLNGGETRLLEEARRVVSGIPEGASVVEKEKYLHDYLCEHVSKDYHGNSSHADTDTAVGALIYGAADCDGYSDAFDLLCTVAGIPARMMEGRAGEEEHAWNLVSPDGGVTWYMTDVTWDDNDGEAGFAGYAYFNIGTDSLAGAREWNSNAVPVTPSEEDGPQAY